MSVKSYLMTVLAVATIVLGVWMLVAASGCAHHDVAPADLPPAVRATLERETAGGKVTEIEKEKRNGKVVYSADAKIGDKKYDIVIGEDGKLISKEVEK